MTVLLSFGIVSGCNSADNNEPDPSEEPSEQHQQDKNNDADDNEPDPTEEPSEQKQQENEQKEEENE
ncbi:hypothetical protein CUU66_10305 [Peribacillus deserti]|uniref:Uncharacterized protein n=2 Tax=Peribacillus deserti TaxID=673318 RepID=A0A2N5M6R1_9BACI|nr:hypothetical protein [Peribacillus deserti]PLT29983.1 hypothetical protein CUU66_10305 [Peribacillus deserti]